MRTAMTMASPSARATLRTSSPTPTPRCCWVAYPWWRIAWFRTRPSPSFGEDLYKVHSPFGAGATSSTLSSRSFIGGSCTVWRGRSRIPRSALTSCVGSTSASSATHPSSRRDHDRLMVLTDGGTKEPTSVRCLPRMHCLRKLYAKGCEINFEHSPTFVEPKMIDASSLAQGSVIGASTDKGYYLAGHQLPLLCPALELLTDPAKAS
jgi:hypothetical protein